MCPQEVPLLRAKLRRSILCVRKNKVEELQPMQSWGGRR